MEQSGAAAQTTRRAELVDIPAVARLIIGAYPVDVTPAEAETVERVTRLQLAHFALEGRRVWITEHPRHGLVAVAAVLSRDERPRSPKSRELLTREAPQHLELLDVVIPGYDTLAGMLPGRPEVMLALARTEDAAEADVTRAAEAALASLGDSDRPIGGITHTAADLPVFRALGYGPAQRHRLPTTDVELWLCQRGEDARIASQ